jgi:hypothetical protein
MLSRTASRDSTIGLIVNESFPSGGNLYRIRGYEVLAGSSATHSTPVSCLAHSCPEDGGGMFRRNVSGHIPEGRSLHWHRVETSDLTELVFVLGSGCRVTLGMTLRKLGLFTGCSTSHRADGPETARGSHSSPAEGTDPVPRTSDGPVPLTIGFATTVSEKNAFPVRGCGGL